MKKKKKSPENPSFTKRAHAGLYSCPENKVFSETAVVDDWARALGAQGKLFFSNLRHVGSNSKAPDVVANDFDGGRIGIEITELVDEDSVRMAAQGKHYEWKDWRGEFVPKLEDIIRRKDSAKVEEDFSQYILVIHSDEPWLDISFVENSLETFEFSGTALINRAFLIMYETLKSVPACFEIQIHKKEGS